MNPMKTLVLCFDLSVTLSSRLFFLTLLILLGATHDLLAQCGGSNLFINWNDTAQQNSLSSVTLGWDPPPNTPAGSAYQVMQATAPDYCSITTAVRTVATTTTATSITLPLQPNYVYAFSVELQSNPCINTGGSFIFDSLTNDPATPAPPVVSVSGNNATVTFTYDDFPHATGVLAFRMSPDAKSFHGLKTFVFSCTPNQSFSDVDIPNGPWQYFLESWNSHSLFSDVSLVSSPVSVFVGPPIIVSFSAVPLTVRAGQPVILSWIAEGTNAVQIDNGVGSQPVSGAFAVSPSATTTYTLTASNASGTTTATATVNVITAPFVLASLPAAPLVQTPGNGGATTSYTLTNAGGTATTVNLSASGTFFTQSPALFSLGPGASQLVTITGLPEPAGEFEGASLPSGNGVAPGLSIPIRLLSAALPSSGVGAKAAATRIDVAGAAGTSPSGTAKFTNTGTGTLTGILVSDVPWIVPQSGLISIPPGATAGVSFAIDRSQRPDADAPLGSASGKLSLVYLSGASGKVGTLDVATPTVTFVTIVDTVQLTVTSGAPPPLASGEVALFIPGVGHVSGSVGTFLSDVSVLNPAGNPSISDIRFYYTPVAGAPQSASFPPLGGVSVALADVVKNVFGSDNQVGSLQIRSASTAKLSVTTNIFNASNPAGTYGTSIPTFRSDRAVGAGHDLVLTGLRQDANSHTNLFIQETSGLGVTVRTQFLDVNGNVLGTRSDTVGAFALDQINNQVPPNAVAAVMTNMSSGNAAFLAYATPVDQVSGDNWAIVDWSHQYRYSGSDPVIVPVAGVLQGANDTFFRTDVAITNTGSSPATGTLRFYPRAGAPVDRAITLGGMQTSILANAIGSLFGEPSGTVGYLLFTPAGGSFAITSRTYTTAAGSSGTFGTDVPTLPAAGSMTIGGLRAIGSLQDATLENVITKRPATFRTNFGLMETSGNSVTVRVTLRFTYPAGAKVQGIGSAFKDYTLNPNQFLQVPIASDILGSNRDALGDLRDLEADFQLIGGSGAVAVYTSSTDNGTGDVILRTE